VEVLFVGRSTARVAADRSQVFLAPTLVGLPVERTLWTVYSPVGLSAEPSLPGGAWMGDLRQEWLRLSTAAALLDRAAAATAETQRQEEEAWRLPWASRCVASQSKIARHLSAPGGKRELGAEQLGLLEAQQEAAEDRLKSLGLRQRAAAESKRSADAGDLWESACQPVGPASKWAVHGLMREAAFRRPNSPKGDLYRRIGVAAAMIGLCAAARLLASRGPLWEWLIQWPSFFCVLAGLAWWLWLSPSLFGWVLVAAGLLASVRSPWPAAGDPR
jgi:hypothetical protein